MSLEDLAQITKISRAHLEAIENDNFQVLPAPVFARGFVRSYGAAVGLEPNELVRGLPSSLDVVESRTTRRRSDNLSLLATNRQRAEGLVGRSSQMLLVLVAAAMFLTAWWMMGQNNSNQTDGTAAPKVERQVPQGTVSDASAPTPRR